MSLTDRQGQVLRILCESDVPPSYRELASATGVSVNTSRVDVLRLAKLGLLSAVGTAHRSIRVTAAGRRRVPLPGPPEPAGTSILGAPVRLSRAVFLPVVRIPDVEPDALLSTLARYRSAS